MDPLTLGLQGAALALQPDTDAAWQSLDQLELTVASIALSWGLTVARLRSRRR